MDIDTIVITVNKPTNSSPVVQIISPAEGSTFTVGDAIQFTGSCIDDEDGHIGDAFLVWSSHVDGQIGTGEAFTSDTLSQGVHQITLTATDSEGAVGMDTIVITVNKPTNSGTASVRKDVCVYGGTAGGVIAAYAAADMGASVVLVEPGTHLGGMTSGGLGATDTGDTYSIVGLARNFYERLGAIYGKNVSWTHEPHVAEEVLNEMISEKNVTILFGRRIRTLNKTAGVWIQDVVFENSMNPAQPIITVSAGTFIDATYEGDLMARAGVSHIVGRESNGQYHETYNGVRRYATMPGGVDPYIVPGNPLSGLLPFSGISTNPIGINGSVDGLTQAYCFRLCMTTNTANRREIEEPVGYDPGDFEFFLRTLKRKNPANLSEIFFIRKLPNDKWDWNSNENAGVSLDLVGASHAYPEADYQTRQEIRQVHLDYTTGLLYFLGHGARSSTAYPQRDAALGAVYGRIPGFRWMAASTLCSGSASHDRTLRYD